MVNSKKRICIAPVDDVTALQTEAISLLNSYKRKGYLKREDFITAVKSVAPELTGYKTDKKLETFWSMRLRDEEINSILSRALGVLPKFNKQ